MIKLKIPILLSILLSLLLNYFYPQTDSLHASRLNKIKATFKRCVPCSEDSLKALQDFYSDSVYEKEQLMLTIFRGQALKRNGNYTKAKALFNQTIKHDASNPISTSAYYYDFLINYGNIYYNLEQYDSAIIVHKNTLSQLNADTEIEDRIRYKEMVYSNLTNVYTSQLDYENAIDLLIQAMKTDFDDNFHINQNLARQYSELKMYDEAIRYYKKSLSLTDDINLIASSYLNLGAIYDKKEVKDTALFYMKKCLDTVQSIQTKIYCSYNLTDYYLGVSDFEMTLKYINEGRALAQPLNNAKYNSLFDLSSGTLALKQKNYTTAIKIYEKIDLKKVPWHDFHLEYLDNYRKACKAVGKTKKAYELLDKYVTLKDSIETYQNEVRFVSIINNYHLRQKQDEIKLLSQKNELIAQKKEIERQKAALLNETVERQKTTIIWIVIIATILLLSVFLLVKYRLRRKKIENELLIEKQKLKEIEIESLNQKIESEKIISGLQGEEKERSRLASELHDGIGSALTGLRLKMHSQRGNNEFETELSDIYNEVRLISHRLSPPIENDVYKLISGLTERYFSYTPIQYAINWFPEDCAFTIKGSDKINFYRIIQETFNNIIKHSQAKEIEISVNIIGNSFNLIIEDDGIGFNTPSTPTPYSSFGLSNINKRAAALNAQLDIDSKVGRGTSISLTFNIEDYD